MRIGNQVWKIKDVPWPATMSKTDRERTAKSVTDWSGYLEAEIARGLISIGVPEDEASRKAASATLVAVAAGATAGTAAFLATTIVVGVITVPLGALIGAGVGAPMAAANPAAPLIAAGIGAGIGGGIALAAGAGAGAVAATLFGIGGGVLGYWLGTGDPGSKAQRPHLPWEQSPPPRDHIMIVNPDGNQFEAHLPAPAAKNIGLPQVDYVVTQRGDVNVNIGGNNIGWTAEQAQAPIQAIEKVAPGAERAINDGVRTISREVSKVLPDLNVTFPQEKKSVAKHG